MNFRSSTDVVAPLMVACFWGLAFIWIKTGLTSFDPFALVVLRLSIAALGFVGLMAMKVIRFHPVAVVHWPRMILLAGSGVFAYHLSLVTAEQELDASVASLIGQTMPLFALSIEVIAHAHALSRRMVMGVLMASGGSILVISSGHMPASGGLPFGSILLCFLAPLSLSLYTFSAKPMVEKYGAANLTAQVFVLSACILSASVLVVKPSIWAQISTANRNAWFSVVCLSVFSTVAAYTLWFRSLETRTASQLSMYNYCVPLFSLIAAYLFIGEEIHSTMILGGFFVVGGIAITRTAPKIHTRASR